MGGFLRNIAPAELRDRISDPKTSAKNHQLGEASTQPAGNLATQRLLRSGALRPKAAMSQADGNHAGVASITELGAGRPLDTATREFFESRFGADFRNIRVHTERGAAESAESINASAYTVGRDVVFAPGRYAPETTDGRRLLAHELTHVVQQDSLRPSSPRVQRKLLVTGKDRDIKAFIGMLEPASGLRLRHEGKTKEMSITGSRLKAPSAVLAGRLATIIDDPAQHAELNLGRRQPGVSLGAFPSSEPFIQQIDIDDMERLEARAPGSGVAFLVHEIVENYHAHTPELGEFHHDVVFSESHRQALEAERLVAQELVGRPGGRVADATTTIGSDVVRRIDDYETYFLVIDHLRDVLTAARQVSRVNVSKYRMSDFGADPTVIPATVQPIIAALVDDLVANPVATVLVESGDPEPRRAQRRAEEIRDAILSAGKGRKGFDLRSWRNFHLVGFGLIDIGAPGSNPVVRLTVDKPDIDLEEQRGRLVKKVLPAARRR